MAGRKFYTLLVGWVLDVVLSAVETVLRQARRLSRHLFKGVGAYDVFHWLLGVCYLSAFVSLYVQWDGLLSYNGLEPADMFVDRVRSHFLRGEKKISAQEGLWTTGLFLMQKFASLVVIAPELGMTPDGVAQVLMLVGTVSSALIVAGLPLRLLFFLCWICYVSIQHVGQTWLSFQWDILLLEVGFLAIFSSTPLLEYALPPRWSLPCLRKTPLAWCYRFLAWKLMFLSGSVKLQARCPTWEGLTALEYHFATQCLPTPLAWFFHQLPPVVLRASVAATIVIEIPLAFLLLSPLRTTRRVGAGLQLTLQFAILLTGNYNFFNVLTCALMVMAWADDDADSDADAEEEEKTDEKVDEGEDEGKDKDGGNGNGSDGKVSLASRALAVVKAAPFFYLDALMAINRSPLGQSIVFHLANVSIVFWALAFVSHRAPPSHADVGDWYWTGEGLRLRLKWDELAPAMTYCCGLAVYWTLLHAAYYGLRGVCADLYMRLFPRSRPEQNSAFSLARRLAAVVTPTIKSLAHLAFALTWVLLSATSLSSVSHTERFHLPRAATRLAKAVAPWSLVSSYGLFRSMTGVSKRQGLGQRRTFVPSMVARPEVVLQGLVANAAGGAASTERWVDIPFAHKPGPVLRRPTLVAPMQPRLDWQMWFAALGTYQHQPWLVHLVYRLLREDALTVEEAKGVVAPSSVTRLLGPEYPSLWGSRRRPAAIRAVLYEYDFTRWNTTWARAVPEAAIVPLPTPPQPIVGLLKEWAIIHDLLFATTSDTNDTSSTGAPACSKEEGEEACSSNAAKGEGESEFDDAKIKGEGKPPPSSDVVTTNHTAETAWWSRRNPAEYLPALDLNNPTLESFLRQVGLDPDRAGSKRLSPRGLFNLCVKRAGGLVIAKTACHALLWRDAIVLSLTTDAVVPLSVWLAVVLILHRRKLIPMPIIVRN